MAKVTVALLSWNQSAFVQQALDSILGQSFTDFDLIIVDNGSADDSLARIDEILSRQSQCRNLRLISNESNLGINPALNQALRIADSEYFVPFAADDVMFPSRLELQTELFDALPRVVGALASACQKIDSHGSDLGLMLSPSYSDLKDQRRQLIRLRQPLAPATMFRSIDLDSLNGFDEKSVVEDLDTFLRLTFVLGREIRTDSRAVTYYRWHGQNNSSKSDLMKGIVPYSLARIADQGLSRKEARLLGRTLTQSVFPCPSWDCLVATLASTQTTCPSQVRGLARKTIAAPGVPGVNRLKAFAAFVAPEQAAKRVRG